MCTLKGACQYTLFDVRGVEIHSIHTSMHVRNVVKDQSNVCMSKMSKMVLSKMCLYVLFPSSMSSTYIALQPLGAFDLSLTSSCFNIHSIGWYDWKALSLSFLKLFVDENHLNIKKVMSINVSVCSFPIFDIFNIHIITALRCFDHL